MHVDDIKIDPELEALLPALPEAVRTRLREAMIHDGFVDGELTVWKGHSILLDGHNRLREYKAASVTEMIAPPRIREREFSTRKDAMEWMIEYQDGRRNWTKAERKIALGLIYNEAKKPQGNPDFGAKNAEIPEKTLSGNTLPDREPPQDTAVKIAEEKGVSEKTVRTAGKFAEAVEKIRQVNPKAAADIKAETFGASQADVIAIANSGDIAKALKNLKIHGDWRGEPKSAPPAASSLSKLPADITKRIQALVKQYNTFGGSVAWLQANAKREDTKNILATIDGQLKAVYREVKKLEGLVK